MKIREKCEECQKELDNSNYDIFCDDKCQEKYRDKMLYNKEIRKLKERERIAKIKEKAEKDYYGKVKTKREHVPKDVRETVFHKYDNECAVCGRKEGLHVHHKDNDSKNNRMSNLVLLCGVCHKKAHMKVR